jgi:RNA polymerase subunit RPABC4/transcription elongation factor Spt4
MVKCPNCGHDNAEDVNFCRFCGTKLFVPQQQRSPSYNYAPPRPYAWKTDEFQTETEPRQQINADVPATVPQGYSSPPANYQYQALDGSYRCPRCGTSFLPVRERRVSTAGCIVFSVLLVFTLVFFWIGLLMKEDVAVCPVCKYRLS